MMYINMVFMVVMFCFGGFIWEVKVLVYIKNMLVFGFIRVISELII